MRTTLLSVVVALFVAACGGGGPGTDPRWYELETAMVTIATTTTSFTATAADGADVATITLDSSPGPDTVFEGVLRKTSNTSLTIKLNGAVLAVEQYITYFSLSPFKTYGATYSDGSYAVATGEIGLYPMTTEVGASGSIGTLTSYTSDQKLAVDSTTISNWTLEHDSATTAWGCTNSDLYDAFGVLQFTTSGCFKLDGNGNILGIRYTMLVDGQELTFQ